jgi:alpha/beta superfamily hydrolase
MDINILLRTIETPIQHIASSIPSQPRRKTRYRRMPSTFEKDVRIKECRALVGDMQSRVAVIVTHPWGPLGGNMKNNVVLATVLFFQKSRITTLRFDFVGSQISRGRDEVQQVCDAADHLLRALSNPPTRILLVGYSYGSLISASASAKIPECIGCISIAPPWSVQHWLLMFNSNYHMQQSRECEYLPRLFVIGDHDNFTTEKTFLTTVKTFRKSTGAVLKDADHFFVRREQDLMSIIQQWLLQTFPQAGGSLARFGECEIPLPTSDKAIPSMSSEIPTTFGCLNFLHGTNAV